MSQTNPQHHEEDEKAGLLKNHEQDTAEVSTKGSIVDMPNNEKSKLAFKDAVKQFFTIKYLSSLEIIKQEDWWSVWIGFAVFCFVLPVTLAGHVEAPIFKSWESNPVENFNTWVLWVSILVLFVMVLVLVMTAYIAMKREGINFWSVFGVTLIFVLAVLAKFIGSNAYLKRVGLGDSVWAILFGLVITNTLCLCRDENPLFIKSICATEFYIKISVVLLAVDLSLFGNVGYKGLIVTWIDTPMVMLSTFLVGAFLFKLCNEDAIIVAAALSVCGSSAATAVGVSVKGNEKTVKFVIAIMSFFTIPVIAGMSMICNFSHMKPEVAGAWIGGSVDSTGAVIATANLVGPVALQTAAIIKMMQNIMIGPICLILTVLVTRKFHPKILWDRFPKFVLGFLVLSVILSTAVPKEQRATAQHATFVISEWFSTLGFVCIGLELNFKKFFKELQGSQFKMILLYVLGQGFDILTTCGFAFLAFMAIP